MLKRNVKMITIIELKKCIANAHILNIIVYKISYRQELSPIILLSIQKNLIIYFYCTIQSLGLTIFLLIKDTEELLLNAKKVV